MKTETQVNGATLLIVEDDPAMLVAFRDILEGNGFVVSTATNGTDALVALQEENPALIMSDISMPGMDGIELYKAVRQRPNGAAIPFIFVTARGTREDIFAAKALGVDDYITKPVTSRELLAAVRARLQRSDEIMLVQLKAVLRAMANAIEARAGEYTLRHVEAVNAYSQALGLELEWDQDDLESLEFGAILHDVGKIGISELILCKPGRLTPSEVAEMQKHPEIGRNILCGITQLQDILPAVLHHHEWLNGAGYPGGLASDQIPWVAKVVGLADAFDAMTTRRKYREALPLNAAMAEIRRFSGTQFCP
ncbi:MAG: response regulator, partial [Nitrospirae bacterium]|nr:response regulator [Nitrospirota bacterium]